MSEQSNYIDFLKRWFPVNKVKGLLAQLSLEEEFQSGFLKDHREKFYPGCWVVSPKSNDSHRMRYAISVHGSVLSETAINEDIDVLLGNQKENFYKIAKFLDSSSFGVIYAVPYTTDGTINFTELLADKFDSINWKLYAFNGRSLGILDASNFFTGWRSGMKPRKPQESQKWDDNMTIINKLSTVPAERLGTFVLKEIFYTGYLKSVVKVSTDDPYDIDGFVVSNGTVFPIELKEKSPVFKKYKRGGEVREHYFGIDSGRISCLERICSPLDANALYIIREVDDGEDRRLLNWKYMTLSGIVMASSWNAIGGGTGMFGSTTSTAKLPYGEFSELTRESLSDENLKSISSRTQTTRTLAENYRSSIKSNT